MVEKILIMLDQFSTMLMFVPSRCYQFLISGTKSYWIAIEYELD